MAEIVFSRLETQFSARLVRDAFGYIETARFGMSEIELVAALNLCQADWAVFLNAVRPLLCESAGQYNFASSVMRRAYITRYLSSAAETQKVHRRLIAFFESAPSAPRGCNPADGAMASANQVPTQWAASLARSGRRQA